MVKWRGQKCLPFLTKFVDEQVDEGINVEKMMREIYSFTSQSTHFIHHYSLNTKYFQDTMPIVGEDTRNLHLTSSLSMGSFSGSLMGKKKVNP